MKNSGRFEMVPAHITIIDEPAPSAEISLQTLKKNIRNNVIFCN
jgi:hypothetical protein